MVRLKLNKSVFTGPRVADSPGIRFWWFAGAVPGADQLLGEAARWFEWDRATRVPRGEEVRRLARGPKFRRRNSENRAAAGPSIRRGSAGPRPTRLRPYPRAETASGRPSCSRRS